MTNVIRDETKPAGTPGSLKLATPERAQRVSQAEMLRSMMHRWESATHERAAVEISRNAQGKVQVKVSVNDPDPEVAAARAREIYDALAMVYPYDPVAKPAASEKA